MKTIVDPEALLLKAMAMEEGSVRSFNQAAIECGANAEAASEQILNGSLAMKETTLANLRSKATTSSVLA